MGWFSDAYKEKQSFGAESVFPAIAVERHALGVAIAARQDKIARRPDVRHLAETEISVRICEVFKPHLPFMQYKTLKKSNAMERPLTPFSRDSILAP